MSDFCCGRNDENHFTGCALLAEVKALREVARLAYRCSGALVYGSDRDALRAALAKLERTSDSESGDHHG